MTDTPPAKRPLALAIWLLVAGLVGFYAAFTLTLDKFAAAADKGFKPSCDISFIVQCTKNLGSWQGSLFGFPNPLIGVAAWAIVIVFAVTLLAGITFPRWYWIVFNAFVVLAMAFIIFLISQSIFSLHTLCIYCMMTWTVTIPTFWAVTLRNIATYGSGRVQKFARAASGWVVIISLVCFVIIAVMAQVVLGLLDFTHF